MKTNKEDEKNKSHHHSPGAGSDKQHPETPSDANERFKKNEKGIQENPGSQNSG